MENDWGQELPDFGSCWCSLSVGVKMAAIWNGNGPFLWLVLLANSSSAEWIVAACIKFLHNIALDSQKSVLLFGKVTVNAENASISYLETFVTVTASFAKAILSIPVLAAYKRHFHVFFTTMCAACNAFFMASASAQHLSYSLAIYCNW